MNERTRRRMGISIAALAAAVLALPPTPGFGQTPGLERRQNRRETRDDARATRQQGRHDARDAKQACKDAGGNPMDCRQQKREMKQDSRGQARDLKWGQGGNAGENQQPPTPHAP